MATLHIERIEAMMNAGADAIKAAMEKAVQG